MFELMSKLTINDAFGIDGFSLLSPFLNQSPINSHFRL